MEKKIVENLIEKILKGITGLDVSICILGDECSINLSGELSRFEIDGETICTSI